MKAYLKILSIFYFVGFILHALDLFGLRLEFSEMNSTWKLWIVYLTFFDLLTCIGLWKEKAWGAYLFFLVAFSQLIAYSGYFEVFGKNQMALILFHITSLIGYLF